ncbi:sarcosine oxidase subunit gamma [Palleronia sediminis]|uniref:Sarcosine oxidase subunit gamma n=1 Tax=Palleronia sediminis TaxID=2547833 RepID=A0A4R6A5U0_9RHOB|nr:sarcosine oxidase subunit gamma family protein [Palleronia sediminis]TDL78064.1 sarcosine oxidase subunit gamma [Palleronia sediminis]
MSDLRRAHGYVELAEVAPGGMVLLRAAPDTDGLAEAVAGVGGELPGRLRISSGDVQVAWMAPDELLILTPDAHGATVELGRLLEGRHHLALDVSDLRARFTLRGARVREVLAKLAPVDMAPAAMPPGAFRRTRLAQIPAALWLSGETTAHAICFRSVADYAFATLATVSREGGEIGLF